MFNNNKKSKIRQMDNIKEIIFDRIISDFNKKFNKDITNEDIFIVAEAQQKAIEKAFITSNNIRCMYLGTFVVADSYEDIAIMRKNLIEQGYSPSDAQSKAVQLFNIKLEEQYKESCANNTYGKVPKKPKKIKINTRINKTVNIPINLKFKQ